MKIRYGMISNSSSTSFVVRLSDFSEAEQQGIDRLVDRSDDFSRCTGRISDLDAYLKMYAAEEWVGSHHRETALRCLMEQYPDLLILRESDEQMGGEFSDVGLEYDKIAQVALLDFEQH